MTVVHTCTISNESRVDRTRWWPCKILPLS